MVTTNGPFTDWMTDWLTALREGVNKTSIVDQRNVAQPRRPTTYNQSKWNYSTSLRVPLRFTERKTKDSYTPNTTAPKRYCIAAHMVNQRRWVGCAPGWLVSSHRRGESMCKYVGTCCMLHPGMECIKWPPSSVQAITRVSIHCKRLIKHNNTKSEELQQQRRVNHIVTMLAPLSNPHQLCVQRR